MNAARLLILLMAGAFASVAHAQSAAAIRGTVRTSDTGAPIAGAVVRLTPKHAGLRLSAKTDKSGRFRLTDVAPGSYRVTVECEGFRSSEVGAIDLASRDAVSLDIPLSPAP